MILLIDNFDSFVHNLARYFVRLGQAARVVRNDAITVDEIAEINPAAIVLSPGPCTPKEAGVCEDVVRTYHNCVPMLGVCLGHQCIATALGGAVVRADEPVHGRTSEITHDHSELFAGLPNPLTVCRYHSLIVDETCLPAELELSSRTSEGTPMALCHRAHPVFGVQFHPEAILTEHGFSLLVNFLRSADIAVSAGRLPTRDDELCASEPKPPATSRTPITF